MRAIVRPCVGSGKLTTELYRFPMNSARSRSCGAP